MYHYLSLLMLLVAFRSAEFQIIGPPEPTFVAPVENVTVAMGREAKLSCAIENLGTYKVAWIHKSLERVVLTVGNLVVTKNPRVSVTREGLLWVLSVSNASLQDAGIYMCQINTKPSRKQIGLIRIVVPPLINDNASSDDVTVDEGSDVMVTCDANGDPTPVVRWIREDGKKFFINSSHSTSEHLARSLYLKSTPRSNSGAYLCVASNGVPPSVSKRVLVRVNFPPVILSPVRSVYNPLGITIGTPLTLGCSYDARPKGKVEWFRNSQKVVSSPPGITTETLKRELPGSYTSFLYIMSITKYDYGTYKCIIKNFLGQAKEIFEVVEITTTSTTTTTSTSTTAYSAPTSSTNYPQIKYQKSSTQPPFYAIVETRAALEEAEATTPASQKRLIQQNENESVYEHNKKTHLTFGSVFGSNSSYVEGCWFLLWVHFVLIYALGSIY